MAKLPGCGCLLGWCQNNPGCWLIRYSLTPSADLPACRDEDPAHAATRAACYPDSPEYQHPEDNHG